MKKPEGMTDAEFVACCRHWYECKGCELCQSMRDRVKAEDQHAVSIVNAIVAAVAKRPRG